MNVTFTYDTEKDIWCLLNKGKSSNNSPNPTKQYELLVEQYGDDPTAEDATALIDRYIAEKGINISERKETFQQDWESVSSEFHKRAEGIFDTSLPADITAYLTINSRCPYNIKENFFYVSLQSTRTRNTAMHELWHFYTWYGLGADQVEKLGKGKYNDLKEALTVLLNSECKDLLSENTVDAGYPQHRELRENMLAYWQKDRNIHRLWDHFSA